MSGGYFEFNQFHIGDIADTIESIVAGTTTEVVDWETGEEAPLQDSFRKATITELKNAVKALRIAGIYAQRIDWLLSSDDSEDSFHKRLAEDLKEY